MEQLLGRLDFIIEMKNFEPRCIGGKHYKKYPAKVHETPKHPVLKRPSLNTNAASINKIVNESGAPSPFVTPKLTSNDSGVGEVIINSPLRPTTSVIPQIARSETELIKKVDIENIILGIIQKNQCEPECITCQDIKNT